MSVDNRQIKSSSDPMTLPQTSGTVARIPAAVSDESTSMPTSRLPRLAYSVREAAEILGVSEKSVRRLIARRLLRPSRALRHLLIPRSELDRFLKETISQ